MVLGVLVTILFNFPADNHPGGQRGSHSSYDFPRFPETIQVLSTKHLPATCFLNDF
jgi:hypothetical protein